VAGGATREDRSAAAVVAGQASWSAHSAYVRRGALARLLAPALRPAALAAAAQTAAVAAESAAAAHQGAAAAAAQQARERLASVCVQLQESVALEDG
jgi:hypothetical protein